MDMFELVGKRVRVKSKDGKDIGLGTYLWRDEILLDLGKKIQGKECSWEAAPPSEVPPFDVVLLGDIRVFEGDANLRKTEYYLAKGDKVRIEKIALCGWNHGNYVAGRFFFQGDLYLFLMSEMELPKMVPHLQVVG